MADKSESNAILNKIIDAFKAQYPDYNIYDYDEVKEEDGVKLPTMMIQLLNFEGANNKIREIFRVNATFRAYICESFKTTEDGPAKRRVRDTSLAVAKFIEGNNWGAKDVFNNASFSYATEDEFNEKISSCEVWYDEWEQQLFSNK